MNSTEVLQAWQQLVPPGICVVAGPVLEYATPLTVREHQSVGGLNAERMREFECGRLYAKRALSMLGIDQVDLPVAPDRSPLWPNGVVGSLAHTSDGGGGHVAAVVARTQDFCAIGIDVERDDPLHPSLWQYILCEREFERILSLSPEIRPSEVQVIWCAKEAVAKAARQAIEPTEIDVEFDLPRSGGFVAQLRAGGPEEYSSQKWQGRTVRSQGLILAAVIQPANPGNKVLS
jgi:enterobactin synthetase component D